MNFSIFPPSDPALAFPSSAALPLFDDALALADNLRPGFAEEIGQEVAPAMPAMPTCSYPIQVLGDEFEEPFMPCESISSTGSGNQESGTASISPTPSMPETPLELSQAEKKEAAREVAQVVLPPSLEEQLDFIIECTKKAKKGRSHPIKSSKKGLPRRRKTGGQLEILEEMCAGLVKIEKDKIRQLSLATGLKEIQVYKWFWDHKKKYQPGKRERAERSS